MKRFAFAILAIVVTIALASCEREKVKPEPSNPAIINSEVVDTGQAGTDLAVSTVTSPEGDTIGTTLSYTSWIKVRTETKAASEKTVEVVLSDTLLAVGREDSVYVNMGEVLHGMVYDAVDFLKNPTERHDGHVTIVDSVMRYSVLILDYEIVYYVVYQVATYDDGFSRQLMPYHRPEIVYIGEGVEDEVMDTIITESGFKQAIHKVSHYLTVRIADQNYIIPNYRIVKESIWE